MIAADGELASGGPPGTIGSGRRHAERGHPRSAAAATRFGRGRCAAETGGKRISHQRLLPFGFFNQGGGAGRRWSDPFAFIELRKPRIFKQSSGWSSSHIYGRATVLLNSERGEEEADDDDDRDDDDPAKEDGR
ncbi:hypothetical protein NL676_027571 [Syzygium grande]|nr:hypothetical protein NL676_027571 [Syzygium grande]